MRKIALPAVFCFFFFGAAGQNLSGADIWTETNSINDFIGKWEGFAAVEIPEDLENFIPKSSIGLNIVLEYTPGSAEITGYIKIDYDKFLADMIALLDKQINAILSEAGGAIAREDVLAEIMPGGLTKDAFWSLLADTFELDENQIIGNYFIQVDLTESTDSFFDSDGGTFMINGPKDRIKMLFPESLVLNMADTGFSEIILDRIQR